MVDKKAKSKMGKKSRAAGLRFENKVRKDLESQGWIVCKWMNNVELVVCINQEGEFSGELKLASAKRKYNPFNKALSIGTGFPDFIAYRLKPFKFNLQPHEAELLLRKFNEFMTPETRATGMFEVIGVESKMNGVLDKEEKKKSEWLYDHLIFSKIIVASRGEKRGSIIYQNYDKSKGGVL